MAQDYEWLRKYVADWITKLPIKWDVRIGFDDFSKDPTFTRAYTTLHQQTHVATIAFDYTIEDNEQGHIDIIHELLHVVNGDVSSVVQNIIIMQACKCQQESLDDMYRFEMEPMVDGLAVALHRMGCNCGRASQTSNGSPESTQQ